MSLKPIPLDKIQTPCQMLLAYLDDPENKTPNNMLEGIVSIKSLIRGVVNGQLFICEQEDPRQPGPAEPVPEKDVVPSDAG